MAANYIDSAPVEQEAARLAAPVAAPALRQRLTQLFKRALQEDLRNARKATIAQLAKAPAWALAAKAEGRPVHTFKPHPRAIQPLEALVERLQSELASTPPPLDVLWAREARILVNRCQTLTLPEVEALVHRLASLRMRAEARLMAAAPRCEAGRVSIRSGAYWERLCTVLELRAAGRELQNCWANQSDNGLYARLLSEGEVWVLRDADGAARAGIAVQRGVARELRGRRNAHFSPFRWDVVFLMAARRISLHVSVLGRTVLADAKKVALWLTLDETAVPADPAPG